MYQFFPVAACILISLPSINVASGEGVYVNMDLAEIRNEQNVSSPVVDQVKRGDALRVLKKGERWYYVTTTNSKRGWIYQYHVTSTPPEDAGDALALLSRSSGGMEMTESSSSSAIRGLSPLSDRYARRRGRRAQDIKAVKQMEQFRVSAKQFKDFLRSGQLGEFQGGSK